MTVIITEAFSLFYVNCLKSQVHQLTFFAQIREEIPMRIFIHYVKIKYRNHDQTQLTVSKLNRKYLL